MIIEKSPYYKSNLGQINSSELVEQKENKDFGTLVEYYNCFCGNCIEVFNTICF